MPKVTLLLGRGTVQVYDLNKANILVGRDPDVDIVIDNPSVSRRHAEIRQEGDEWTQGTETPRSRDESGRRLRGPEPHRVVLHEL